MVESLCCNREGRGLRSLRGYGLFVSIYPILLACTMVLGLTQPITEMSARIILWCKKWATRKEPII
jgi:hypothetical protein